MHKEVTYHVKTSQEVASDSIQRRIALFCCILQKQEMVDKATTI